MKVVKRMAIADIARALTDLQAEVYKAGTIGIKQSDLWRRFEGRLTPSTFYREVNSLLDQGIIRNEGGSKRNRHLVWPNLPKHEPQTIEAMALADAALAHMAKAPMDLEVTVTKNPPAIAFTLNGVHITVKIP